MHPAEMLYTCVFLSTQPSYQLPYLAAFQLLLQTGNLQPQALLSFPNFSLVLCGLDDKAMSTEMNKSLIKYYDLCSLEGIVCVHFRSKNIYFSKRISLRKL